MYFKEKLLIWYYQNFLKEYISVLRNSQTLFKTLF